MAISTLVGLVGFGTGLHTPSMWSKELDMTKVLFNIQQVTKNSNLPKVYGPRNQA